VGRRKKNTPTVRPSATHWTLAVWPSRRTRIVGQSCLKGFYSISQRGKNSRRVRVVATMDFDAPFKVPIHPEIPEIQVGRAEVAHLLFLAIKQLATKSQGGRPHGKKNADTEKRLRLAAALQRLGIKEYAMARYLYPNGAKQSAEKNTDQLLRRNKAQLEQLRKSLSKQAAEDIAAKGMS
jgi:hypothetical protein